MSASKHPHGYTPYFRRAAGNYYNVEQAILMLNTPVAANCYRWRCVLCGWPIDITKEGLKVIGACCCGGCGQTTMRPIEEWTVEK